MPKVTAHMFGPARDAAGQERIEMSLPDGATVGTVAEQLEQRFSGLAGGGRWLRFALREEFVPPETRLAEGDEVAVIPPVSGG